MTRSELIDAVQKITEKLSKPLPPAEYAAGWSEASRTEVLRFFQKLESDLRSGADISYMPIGKGLDSLGIGGGDLLEEACRISLALKGKNW